MSHLEIDQLFKSFGENDVLHDVSFTINDGEFVSLLGPSGSGKSTLFHIIGGISHPSSGNVLLKGESITGKPGSISYTPQSASLMPWRTVINNILLGQEIVGKTDKEKALEMMERAGLQGFENAYPYELSGGMKQRVSFIRSILSPQSLILLDEPFTALDEFTRLDMQKWLLSIWAEYRRSVLFVTHNIEEALFLSDRIVIFTARPATVKKEFVIPFERPRKESILLTEEFLQWKKIIFEEMSM